MVSLRHVSGADNIHYTRDGYENLAASIHATIHSREIVSASCNVAGTGPIRTKQNFFWRGFVSPNGVDQAKTLCPKLQQFQEGIYAPLPRERAEELV